MNRPALMPATRPDDCDCDGLYGSLACWPCYRRGFRFPDQ